MGLIAKALVAYACAVQVLCYHIPRLATSAGSSDASSDDCHDTSSSSTCSFMQAVDGALPPALLQHLQHIFWPGADFWLQHAYGRVGYFSYYFSLQVKFGYLRECKQPQACGGLCIHSVAQHE